MIGSTDCLWAIAVLGNMDCLWAIAVHDIVIALVVLACTGIVGCGRRPMPILTSRSTMIASSTIPVFDPGIVGRAWRLLVALAFVGVACWMFIHTVVEPLYELGRPWR